MQVKRTTVLFVLIFAVIFLGQELLTIVPELVMHAGMCPGTPPDGSPYPCTSTELLIREFSSPFAVAGHILTFFQSAILSLAVWFVSVFVIDHVWRRRRNDQGQ
jgi:hypothetical protein